MANRKHLIHGLKLSLNDELCSWLVFRTSTGLFMQTEWLKAYYIFKLISSWKRHQTFWCCAGVLAQNRATQVLSISSYRPFVLLSAAHLADLPVHTGLQPTHFSTGFSWPHLRVLRSAVTSFPNLSSCGAGDSWLTPNARKGLSCIQSREKIRAREELFIILVP